MARQARFVVPGQVHWVSLECQAGPQALAAPADRQALFHATQLAAQEQRVALHGYALRGDGLDLLLSPAGGEALGMFVQAIGRRFVGPYNRRHGRVGALWSSRYRCAVLEPGDTVLLALCAVCASALPDLAPPTPPAPPAVAAQDCAGHYLGQARLPWLTDLLDFWRLGNEPFAREAQLRSLLDAPELPARVAQFRALARQARALGAPAFLQNLERQTGRAVLLRRPGRPRLPPGNAP